jgi:signal transduction histidine kinase
MIRKSKLLPKMKTNENILDLALNLAKVLNFLVNDIIDVSNPNKGFLNMNNQKKNLFEIGKEVSDIINPRVQAKGLEVFLEI